MSRSVASKASNASSKMLEELAFRSQTKILRVQGSFNDQQMRVIWNSLGLYINRNLRMGRGVNVPKLGIFTLTPPEVRLKGLTNELERDQRPRTPVFLIQKDFVKGVSFKTAIFYHQEFGMGLRPYASFGSNGQVPVTKMNVSQISSYANMSKDATQTALNRLIKYLGQKLQTGNNLNFQIPSVGTLISRGNLVAVKFNQHLHRETRTILSKSVDDRKQRGIMNLTSENLKKLQNFSQMSFKLDNKSKQFFQIDSNAKNYLQNTLGISMNSSGMTRTMTNFNRSFVTRPFDKTGPQMMRMSSTGFSTGKIKNFNRQYNYALKVVKEWVYKNSLSTEKSFRDFCALSGSNKEALIEENVFNACRRISEDITQQQSQELFRLLDFNKDGYVTKDDWHKNINFDSNKLLKELIATIKARNYKISQILKVMKLQGVRIVDVYNLKESLKYIQPNLAQQDALFLSRYICKGKSSIGIQAIIDILNIPSVQSQKIIVDNQWEQKFVGRVKRRMIDNQLFEQDLVNRFNFYDNKGSGFIDQTEFKNILRQIGISLTLSELIRIVKLFPINSSNQLNYRQFVKRLDLIEPAQNLVKISSKQFDSKLLTLLKSQKKPFHIPISVIQLTSYLQGKVFKDYSESTLLSHIQRIDVNGDGIISDQDLKSYQVTVQSKQIPQMDYSTIQNLFTRLREKIIKRKISYADVFKKIDSNNNGFVNRQEWYQNLDKILIFTEVQKINMFNRMNAVKNIDVIDFKTFLSFVNADNVSKVDIYEKYDWVQETLDKIKEWYVKSKLTLEDSFKFIDKDGDTYLNENDVKTFLVDSIKLPVKDAVVVRIQKLIKVLDTFKKGKLNFLDWKNFVHKSKTNWVEDAKQQIGLVISRTYSNLQDAYTNITQGDKKLLFNAFERWIKKNKVLSGFMINEDILKHLFTALDSHKKGFLLEDDFISAFGSYNWRVQHIKEYIEELKTKFKTCNEAFRCLVFFKNGVNLTEQTFIESSITILGKRFSKSDLKDIWLSISSGKSIVSFSQFQNKYGCEWKHEQNVIEKSFPKDSWLYRDFQIIKGTQTRGSQFGYSQTDSMENQATKLLQNLKEMLATSPKTLEQAFLEVDTEKKGKITNLQFKKVFRVLNIALTAKQIDLLLNYCNFQIELIDWRQFIKRVSIRAEKKKIVERLIPRIQHLSDLLHYFMVSPKDAFRKSNNPRTGYMSFQEFYKMVKSLYDQAAQQLPEFQVIRQLFECIDIRKDDQLDFQQFTQIFRNCTPPSLLMGTKPANEQQIMAKFMTSHDEGKPVREQSVPLFKNSPIYEDFVNLIGRNRKYIQTEIENISKQTLVPFEIVEKVMHNFSEKQKFQLEHNLIRNLIAFSMTGQKVDYRLMLNDFKSRSQEIVQFPKVNFF